MAPYEKSLTPDSSPGMTALGHPPNPSDAPSPCNLGQSDPVVTLATAVKDGGFAEIVYLEGALGRGFGGVQFIGPTGKMSDCGQERARLANEHMGIAVPSRKLTISVTPATAVCDGAHIDLPMALLMAIKSLQKPLRITTRDWAFAAELGIDGSLRGVSGIVGFAIAALASGLKGIVVATENRQELEPLCLVQYEDRPPLIVKCFHHLSDVLEWAMDLDSSYSPAIDISVQGNALQAANEFVGDDITSTELTPRNRATDVQDLLPHPTFEDMCLSTEEQKLAEAAAAGMHALFLQGPPGSGKSMFARRVISLFPKLDAKQHLDLLRFHGSQEKPIALDLLTGQPPFRSPHHFASTAALLGSSHEAGEWALATGGVLFLDEFPEFRRDVIEALREPLETGEVQLSRAKAKITWKTDLLLIVAANNCPCGWRGTKTRICECPMSRVIAYRSRVSGPIHDRIDLHYNMPERQKSGSSTFSYSAEKNADRQIAMLDRVARARNMAKARALDLGLKSPFNARIPNHKLAVCLGWSQELLQVLIKRYTSPMATERSIIRCLRVARSLADLDGREVAIEDDLRQAWLWQPLEARHRRGE